ncbi:hypothetical protein MAJ_05302, partial [Metarhizium majus ARSEF 297]
MLPKKRACLTTTQAASSASPFEPRKGITKGGKSIKFKVNIDKGRQGKTGCNYGFRRDRHVYRQGQHAQHCRRVDHRESCWLETLVDNPGFVLNLNGPGSRAGGCSHEMAGLGHAPLPAAKHGYIWAWSAAA